jgi:chromosome segregation ATPase
MAKDSFNRSAGRKSQWFARRQVYLRSGQDSQYVELSPGLQIGVAVGFAALALWLIGTSYSTFVGPGGNENEKALLAQLTSLEQTLGEIEQERDEALQSAAQVAILEAELAEAEAQVADQTDPAETRALEAELTRSVEQIEDLQRRLSEAKADEAALQAKFEAAALANADTSEKTAEEASGLHAQLEEAFGELEALRNERDEATDQLAALQVEATAKEEAFERNNALLKAATAEIERLQEAIALAERAAEDATKDQATALETLQQQLDEAVAARAALEGETGTLRSDLADAKALAEENAEGRASAIETLTEELDEAVAARIELEQEADVLRAQIEEAKTEAEELQQKESAAYADAQNAIDAAIEAQNIKAELQEADFLATIESLQQKLDGAEAEVAAQQAAMAAEEQAVSATSEPDVTPETAAELEELKERLAVAEGEIERLLLMGLTQASAGAASAPKPTPISAAGDLVETERLRSELLASQAEIIKLNADINAAKLRLAEQTAAQGEQASQPNNSAKLEQQLASTRSRMQQLNKALADAKLREVAIDLALINVVPTPSPPAPR